MKELGWHPETSLPNVWPHNTILERHVEVLKGTHRANILQCGGEIDAWPAAIQHAATVVTITKTAPILPSEQNAAGQPRPEFEWKAKLTCWEAHHNGEPFTGPIEPFGRLCW